MKVVWKKVLNSNQFVKDVLAKEADDIPEDVISSKNWSIQEINITDIKIDSEMVTRHDNTQFHIERRDSFIKSIKDGVEIYPLIVMGEENFLVDGYARFRALKTLDIKTIQVFKQD